MNQTIPRLLALAVSATPNRIAATLDDEAVSFLECARNSARLAHALSGWGVRASDRILYWADLSLRAIDLFFAVAQAKAVFIPANPAFSPAEFEAVADYLEPAFIIVDSAHQEAGAAAARKLGARLGVLGGVRPPFPGLDLESAMAKASDAAPLDGPRPEDANVMFLTSGSTGRPKGAILSHRAHWLRAASAPWYDAVCGGPGTACMFPLFHMAGWLMVLQAFGRRRTVHLTRQAGADQLWNVIERHRPQELYCIPAVWRRLLEAGRNRDGSSLISALTGTSRVEPDLVEALWERFPKARTGIFYGSTEMGICLGISHEDITAHPYCVGLPMPGLEARLDDGELLLRADTIMDGYFRLPEETAEVLDSGWYRSGDLATMDAEGYYEIVGRRREIIRSGGESIAPAEVEAAIADYPGIKEVAVIGLPHESWGEIVCAVLVVDAESDGPSLELLRAHLQGRLAPFKHPRLVETRRDPLPRTPATGQVQRSRIRQEISAGLARGSPVSPIRSPG